jgi:hypothetical protein
MVDACTTLEDDVSYGTATGAAIKVHWLRASSLKQKEKMLRKERMNETLPRLEVTSNVIQRTFVTYTGRTVVSTARHKFCMTTAATMMGGC